MDILNILIAIFAVFGLAFAIKQTDGPWDLIAKWRNWMASLPTIGVQFYKLLDCYFCLGFHCGWIVFLLYYCHLFIILWALAGGVICLIMDGVLSRLHRE